MDEDYKQDNYQTLTELRVLTDSCGHCLTIQGRVEGGLFVGSQASSVSLLLSILTHSSSLPCSPIPHSTSHCGGDKT